MLVTSTVTYTYGTSTRRQDEELVVGRAEAGGEPLVLLRATQEPEQQDAEATTAEETEEGAESVVDGDGELTLAADEELDDLTDVALTPGEEAEEEAQAQVGPLGEEVADLELDD